MLHGAEAGVHQGLRPNHHLITHFRKHVGAEIGCATAFQHIDHHRMTDTLWRSPQLLNGIESIDEDHIGTRLRVSPTTLDRGFKSFCR